MAMLGNRVDAQLWLADQPELRIEALPIGIVVFPWTDFSAL